MNLLSFSVTSIFHVIIVEKHDKKRYFETLSDLQFLPYFPIQLIRVGVERSNASTLLKTMHDSGQVQIIIILHVLCVTPGNKDN